MAGVNKCAFIGNLTRDPELKYFDDDSSVANFTIACNESWKDRKTGEWKEKVEFVRVVAWRHLAERAEKYLRKGKQVYVEGKLETRKWQDKDGNDKYTTEIIARDLMLLGRKGDNDEQAPQASPPEAKTDDEEGDDLPW